MNIIQFGYNMIWIGVASAGLGMVYAIWKYRIGSVNFKEGAE